MQNPEPSLANAELKSDDELRFQPDDGLRFQPGDIWQHSGMGRLYVTGEDCESRPGYLRCYWSMGGNPNAPYTYMDANRIHDSSSQFKLISRGSNEST